MAKGMVIANFCRDNGFTFTVVDLGIDGVKLCLSHEREGDAAVVLTPKLAGELADWLARSNGQAITKLPTRLPAIIGKVLANQKITKADREHLSKALKVLAEYDFTKAPKGE